MIVPNSGGDSVETCFGGLADNATFNSFIFSTLIGGDALLAGALL